VAALAGGVGLVALVITTAVVAAVGLVAFGVPEGRAEDTPPPATTTPTPTATDPLPPAPVDRAELVVALRPGDLALQAGVVRGGDVLLARGLEVEVVRAVAQRLGFERVRFVALGGTGRLLAAAPGAWQLAVAGIRPTRATSSQAGHSLPYLTTDQLVLLRRGSSRPRSLAELRTRVLCAIRGSDGAAAARSVRPRSPLLVAPGPERLLQLVQTGACDAALVDPVGATRLLEGRRAVLGPLAARVRFGAGTVIVVRRGSGIELGAVDRALARLRANGTLGRLSRFWLGVDPASLPVLR
jgi:cystine transport system substrate-binding protein